MKRLIYIIMCMAMAVSVQAQTDRQLIRSGNKQYRARNFAAAETEYRKAIGKNSLNARAVYNLGCAMLTQGNDSAAALQFQQAARMSDTKLMKARAYYNEGVAHQKRHSSRTRTTRTKIRTRTRRTNSKSKTSRRTNRNSKRSKVRRSK